MIISAINNQKSNQRPYHSDSKTNFGLRTVYLKGSSYDLADGVYFAIREAGSKVREFKDSDLFARICHYRRFARARELCGKIFSIFSNDKNLPTDLFKLGGNQTDIRIGSYVNMKPGEDYGYPFLSVNAVDSRGVIYASAERKVMDITSKGSFYAIVREALANKDSKKIAIVQDGRF